MRKEVIAIIGISAALLLGTLAAVLVSAVFFNNKSSSGEESALLPPEKKEPVLMYPALSPSNTPSFDETLFPSSEPTANPTIQPSAFPSGWPSQHPTFSKAPTGNPTISPTNEPSISPTLSTMPSMQPSQSAIPSTQPSMFPSISAEPSNQPSMSPTVSSKPSSQPSSTPSSQPSLMPSSQPSTNPTVSTSPSGQPSLQPTITSSPSSMPSQTPTISTSPSNAPSSQPTLSQAPSTHPSSPPTTSFMPTDSPSNLPSSIPTKSPSANPSSFPTTAPSLSPSEAPSEKVVITTIVLNGKGKHGKKGQKEGKAMVAIGGAYFFVLASVGFYLYRKDRKANNISDDDQSNMDMTNCDIEGGILGIAPPPPVEETPAKSVSRRILSPLKSFSSIRSLSPFKTRSMRGKKLVAGNSELSIASGDSDNIPAIQESCSIDSSDREGGSKDGLDALVESYEEAGTEKAAALPNSSKLKPPRDSLDALMDDFDSAINEEDSKKSVVENEQNGSASNSKIPRLEYEEQLLNSANSGGFSFRDIFFDPDNELCECRVPSGRLGIVVDETGIGPRIQKINPMSKLYKKVSVGDIIIAVDDIDLVGAKPDKFWQLASRKANKHERCIVILKI